MIPAFFFRYAYHINIISNFGFYLGSTTGLILDQGSYGPYANLKAGYGIAFPSILGGLTLNLGRRMRVLAGAEYGAVWYPQMTVTTDSGAGHELAPVPDMFSLFAGMDYFYQKNRAISLQLGERLIRTTPLNSVGSYLNTLNIQNQSYFAELGTHSPAWKLSCAFVNQT